MSKSRIEKPREWTFSIKPADSGFVVLWNLSKCSKFEPGSYRVVEYSAYAAALKEIARLKKEVNDLATEVVRQG